MILRPQLSAPPNRTMREGLREMVVARLEGEWKKQLPAEQGRCVVGIVAHPEDADEGCDGYLGPFVKSVMQAKGEPRLLYMNRGSIDEQMAGVDALLLPGGADIHPVYYGAAIHPGMEKSWTDAAADAFELRCIDRAYQKHLPMLGICRGLQSMVVADKGQLYQDLPTEFRGDTGVEVQHIRKTEDQKGKPVTDANHVHSIVIDEQSRLYKVLGRHSLLVISRHHQAAMLYQAASAAGGPAMAGLTLAVTALALDGTVEAVERVGVPNQLGVQFHAEGRKDCEALFSDLVANGAAYRQL